MGRKLSIRQKLQLLCGAASLALASPAAADAFQGLGTLPGSVISFANSVSADGSIVVGFSADSGFRHDQATIWTIGGGTGGLGQLPGTTGSWAEAVSNDGSVVTGESGVEDQFPGEQAFRWTPASGMIALGHLPGDTGSAVGAMSSDGNVIVGLSIGNGTSEAFRWTQAGGMIGLGHLLGDNESDASGASADGSVVVGESYFYAPFISGPVTIGGVPLNIQINITTNNSNSSSGPHREAFRWTPVSGMVGLGFLPGYTTSGAAAVSADGNVIVGSSTSAGGVIQAFRWTQTEGMVGLGFLPGGNWSGASAINATGTVIVGFSNAPGVYEEAVRWTNAQGIRSIASLLADDGVNLGSWQLGGASGVSADGTVIVGTGTDPAGNFEAWIAKIGTGFLSVAALNESLQSVAPVPQIAEQAANADLDDALNSALQFGRSAFDEPVGAWNAWGNFGARQFDLGHDDTEPYGEMGFSYRASQAVHVGIGGHWGSHALDLPILNGRAAGDAWGAAATAAFEPGTSGPRAYVSAIADWLSTDLTRGYLNGITPDQSGGKREGHAYGGALTLGWLLPTSHRLSFMPFASYEAVKLQLDPYTETNGSFPAAFDKIDHMTQITHAGAELRAPITPALHVWGTLDWAHRYDDDGIDVTGNVLALNSPFDVPGRNSRANWVEGSVGASLQLARSVQTHLRLSAAETGAPVSHFTASLGASIRL